MIKPRFIALMLAAFVGFSVNTGWSQTDHGQDDRVEWKVQQSWLTGGKVLDMVNSLDGKYVFLLTDKQQVKVFNHQGKLQGSIPVDPGVTSIDIAPQGETLYLMNSDKQTFTSMAISFVVDIDTSGSPFKGPANAPVTLALFTDFECPYCKKIIPLLDQVLERNQQTVKLVFKNMPLRFHKMAEPSARAALAAHEQGKFWEFHDKLFAESKLSDEAINKVAAELNLDIALFEKDMQSPKIQTKIQEDMLEAQKAGVTGTPTVFINGRTPRQRSLEGFQALIDEELRKLGGK